MQHRQSPIVGVVAGGHSVNFDVQEREAWALIAAACELALTSLDPHHPERGAFVEMWAECRRAAGLPLQPAVKQTA